MLASTNVCPQGTPYYRQVLTELLSPWEISFTDLDHADVVITCDCEVDCGKKSIIIPSRSLSYYNWVHKQNLNLTYYNQRPIQVTVSEETSLLVQPQELYEYTPLRALRNKRMSPSGVLLNDQKLLLKVDVVKEFAGLVSSVLFGTPSKIYSLLTGLPVRYDIAPRRLRNFVVGNHGGREVIKYIEKLPLDALRYLLVGAIEALLGKALLRKQWGTRGHCCLITHDIDSKQGLDRANSVKKLEEKYDLHSAWYLPSEHYPLNHEIVRELANHGEIGVHGKKHAGNLIRLSGKKLFSQLSEARKSLENISRCKIHGFRSPLLQHNSMLLDQLKLAGYAYDTSIPTWEPSHPQTMSSFGIGTVFPLNLRGLTEIPVSIIQDHQLLYVLDLKPKEALTQWLLFMNVVKEIGGCTVLLSHPEYKLFDAQNLFLYEDFLNAAIADKESWFTTPNNILKKIRNPSSFLAS